MKKWRNKTKLELEKEKKLNGCLAILNWMVAAIFLVIGSFIGFVDLMFIGVLLAMAGNLWLQMLAGAQYELRLREYVEEIKHDKPRN